MNSDLLARIITGINSVMNTAFDFILTPFRTVSPWPGMLAVSLVTSVIVLIIFKYTSRQTTLKQKKNKLLANTLELALFKDDIIMNLRAFGRAFMANIMYLLELMVPLLASFVPVTLIIIQLSCWFGARPIRPGETFIATAYFSSNYPVTEQSISVKTSDGITVETDSVRTPSENHVSWRFKAGTPGPQWIDFNINGTALRKTVTVDTRIARISARRVQPGTLALFANPSEPPLPADSPVTSIVAVYPQPNFIIAGINFNWLAVFFVLTLVCGFILKKPMNVEI